MNVRAAVFDLDGTLVDSLRDIAGAMNHTLEAHGLPTHAIDAYRHKVGEGVARLVAKALPPGADDATRASVTAAFRARYAAHILDFTKPYDGVPDMLAALAARGIALAVLSNKPDAATGHLVRALFPSVPFAKVLGHRDDLPRKPDPTSARLIADAMRVATSECAFVGDTHVDMETAIAARMIPIGVLWGFRDREELERAGAQTIVATPSELVARLTVE